MYNGNPGKIDFGSSKAKVRVSEGSSYRESTVRVVLYCVILQMSVARYGNLGKNRGR